jgi:hypothetical protein
MPVGRVYFLGRCRVNQFVTALLHHCKEGIPLVRTKLAQKSTDA